MGAKHTKRTKAFEEPIEVEHTRIADDTMAAKYTEVDDTMAAKYTEVADDEIFEEQIEVTNRNVDGRTAICDVCCLNVKILIKNLACFLCFVCNKYYCEECFIGHDESHKCFNVESEVGEQEAAIDEFLACMEGESDAERERKLMKEDVCVCDFVDIKHGLDKYKDYCEINGLCGTSAGWVVCDSNNSCIKLFSFGTNVLQRYLRLGSKPWDVTEILEKHNSTEKDSASSSSSNISGTDVKPDRKCLIAVTLPWELLILIIDLSKNPAEKVRNIKMEKQCFGIEFYDDKIFTACEETPVYLDDPLWPVYIMSTEGVKLNIINSGIRRYRLWPYLTVLNGNVYMTDRYNHKVYCFNVEGRVLSQTTIEGSFPRGICVDRRNNKVFVCAQLPDKVYELDSDLDRHKSLLDQTTTYMENPYALCFYRNKLYVSHWSMSSRVTVVRLG